MSRAIPLMLAVILPLAGGCATTPTTDPPGTALRITGALTYRPRIALPPGSQAVVELRGGPGASAPLLAEQRIDLGGRQVPVPFALTLERSQLPADVALTLRGGISAGGRPAWATDAVPVDARGPVLDLGELVMTQVPVEAAALWRGRGNEPGWLVERRESGFTLTLDYGERRLQAPMTTPRRAGPVTTWSTEADGTPITIVVTDAPCADGMSGFPFPTQVVVTVGDHRYEGCGGETVEVLQGAEWVVEELNGSGLVDRSRVTLQFDADGRVAGQASCNRYSAGYTLTGETLTIQQPVATLMACAEALMQQEERFLTALAAVERFERRPDGALVFHAAGGGSITARR